MAAPASDRSDAEFEPTDAELLQAHVAGEPDAFRQLFHRHRDRLWAVALRTLADREEAADALQDAMLSAHRAAARFRGDSAVTTWLHRIVINACLDRIRRRRAQPTVPLPEGRPTDDHGRRSAVAAEPAAPVVDHDTVLMVREALSRLPIDQRTAIVLVDLHGYAVAEVAQLLSVAEGTVKSRCARGRARLAGLLGHLRTTGSDTTQAVNAIGNRPPDSSVPSGSRQVGSGKRGGPAATNRAGPAANRVGPVAPEGGIR